jgi:DNA-binding NtrC family response regulator
VSKRVLVVDDEEGLLLTLTANFELAGFEAVGASSAEEALAIVERQSFDLVLSDIRMPGMGGLELFRRLKLRRPELPVILMTAFAVEHQVDDAVAQGVFTVLRKPFDFGRAKEVIENAGRRPEVLVFVEGLASSAATIASGLTTVGVRAQGTGDVEAALRTVETSAIDVCVSDLAAPRSNGADSVTRLRSASPRLVVIAIAPATENGLFMPAARQAFAFVRRPFRLRELVSLIAKARSTRG